MKRWICPNCNAGKLAPARPQKDDVRRFCLPCSAKTGKLVERTCPSLEAERAQRYQAKLEKQRRKRAAATKKRKLAKMMENARFRVGSVDLRQELGRIWKVQNQEPFTRPRPRLICKQTGSGRGWANRGAIFVATGDTSEAIVLATLAHEVAHITVRDWTENHGMVWRKEFVRVVKAAFKVDVSPLAGKTVWDLDKAVEAALVEAGVASGDIPGGGCLNSTRSEQDKMDGLQASHDELMTGCQAPQHQEDI